MAIRRTCDASEACIGSAPASAAAFQGANKPRSLVSNALLRPNLAKSYSGGLLGGELGAQGGAAVWTHRVEGALLFQLGDQALHEAAQFRGLRSG